jgi:hypothetical protein
MQVPIAVMLDVLFRHPAWLQRAGPAALTLTGGGLILAGFFGINFSSEEAAEAAAQEKVRVCARHRAAQLHAVLCMGLVAWCAALRPVLQRSHVQQTVRIAPALPAPGAAAQ